MDEKQNIIATAEITSYGVRGWNRWDGNSAATWSEIEAYNLRYGHESMTSGNNWNQRCREAADYIIGLAERIKSDRSRLAADLLLEKS